MNFAFRYLTVILLGLLFFASCKKKDVNLGTPPKVTFKTDSGYTSGNATIPAGDTIVIGIIADNDASIDKLTKLVIKRAINNSPVTTIKEVTIPGDQNTLYTSDFKFILQTAGTQTYTFVVVNSHGLEGEKTLSLTVTP